MTPSQTRGNLRELWGIFVAIQTNLEYFYHVDPIVDGEMLGC